MSWLDDLQLGDVPTWIAALGGVGAAVLLLGQLRILRKQNAIQQRQLDAQADELARVEEAQRKQLEFLELEIRRLRSSQARLIEVQRLVLPWQDPGSGVKDGYALVLRVTNKSSGAISQLVAYFKVDSDSIPQRGHYCAAPEVTERPVGWAAQVVAGQTELKTSPLICLDPGAVIDLIGPMYSETKATQSRGELQFTDADGQGWAIDGTGQLRALDE